VHAHTHAQHGDLKSLRSGLRTLSSCVEPLWLHQNILGTHMK